MKEKQIWVLSGGNGAGKSTFFRAILEPKGIPFVNADILAKSISPENPEAESRKAARAAIVLLREYIDRGKSFAYETVFSHHSKIELVDYAKNNGYEVNLIFIHLQKGLHIGRVAQRVAQGGHDVPHEKIVSRVLRTMENVARAGKIVDTLILLDNSNKDEPFKEIATKSGGRVRAIVDPLPEWAANLLF